MSTGSARTHRQVCRRGQQTQQRMVSTDEHTHADRHHKRDGRGRDGMGVKHLQKLDIRSDDGNQIPLVPALQFGGAPSGRRAVNTLSRMSASSLKAMKWLQACSP